MSTRLSRLRGISARTPLRIKLVAAVSLLVLLALLGSGFAAAATMRNYLISRADSQLSSVIAPIAEHQLGGTAGNAPGHGGDHGDGDGGVGRLPSAYVVKVVDANGKTVNSQSYLSDPGEPLPSLPHTSVKSGQHYFTTGAEHGDGQWRALAVPVTLTDGSTGTVYIAQSLGDVNGTVDRLTTLLLVIGAVALVVIAGLGYLIVRASLRPLRDVERTAGAIAGGDLSRRVPAAHPRTEVGHLSGALNTMLSDVETAFAERARSEATARESEERMRQFIADASHELRTPLTTIRGFAELYRQGTAAEQHPDVPRLMSRIEQEGARMGLLVEDLLLLARLDQERPLRHQPVDMLALASDAVHDAQAVDPERPIRFEVGPTDPPPVVIGDEPRLRQVLANLLSNALTHTPAGTPVSVRIATTPAAEQQPAWVELTVADQGPGIETSAAARVFERFYRGDVSRSHETGGTGLGLAIVAALVDGHHGTVDLRTAPGEGAVFTVRLPSAPLDGN
jgi:two-component system OmpR family sensor kinase